MKVSLEAALLDLKEGKTRLKDEPSQFLAFYLKEGKTRLKDEPSQFLAFYGNRHRVGVLQRHYAWS